MQSIKVNLWKKAAPLGVGLVFGFGIGVIVVFRQPVRVWDVGEQIRACKNVAPESIGVRRARKKSRETNDCDGGDE